jgi:hypothetical protein
MTNFQLNRLEKGLLIGVWAGILTGTSGMIAKNYYDVDIPEILSYGLLIGGFALNLIGASLQNVRISNEYKNKPNEI